MALDFVIDGYNLLHFTGLVKARIGPGEWERARDRLLKRLRRQMSDSERARTTVVFDAQNAPTNVRLPSHVFGMLVLFTEFGQEADDIIEELVSRHGSPRRLVVISSDRRLKRAALRARATAIASDQFLEQLQWREESCHERIHEAGEPAAKVAEDEPSPEELQQWLNEFRNVRVDEIEAEVRAEQRTPSATTSQRKPSRSRRTESVVDTAESNAAAAETAGKRPRRKSQTLPAADGKEAPLVVDEQELNFWERRIAELDDELGS